MPRLRIVVKREHGAHDEGHDEGQPELRDDVMSAHRRVGDARTRPRPRCPACPIDTSPASPARKFTLAARRPAMKTSVSRVSR